MISDEQIQAAVVAFGKAMAATVKTPTDCDARKWMLRKENP